MISPPTFSKSTSTPSGQAARSCSRQSGVVTVDRGVEPELVDQPLALVLAAGDADRARALELRDLADDRAHGAGRRGHDDGLALLRLADVEQPEVRGHAGEAERPEQALDRQAGVTGNRASAGSRLRP